MRRSYYFVTLLLLLILLVNSLARTNNSDSVSLNQSLKTSIKAREAYNFVKEKNFNTEFCILIDFSVHSGKNRLFLWSFDSSKVILESLVSHGSGPNNWGHDYTKESPIISNKVDSHCSSLGKYKIGKRGWSNWGIHVNYKLHGLDSTNNNAFKRFVVLHSWEEIPDYEPYPNGCPEGWGCPAVSNNIMKELDRLLQPSSKPVLLWIYN